jgi:hypothetical protein
MPVKRKETHPMHSPNGGGVPGPGAIRMGCGARHEGRAQSRSIDDTQAPLEENGAKREDRFVP